MPNTPSKELLPIDKQTAVASSLGSYASASDVALLDGVTAGNRQAIEEFLKRHLPLLRSSVAMSIKKFAHLINQLPPIEDLVQDVAAGLAHDHFAVLRQWDSTKGALRSYLYAYCRRRVYHELRRSRLKEISNSDVLEHFYGKSDHCEVGVLDELQFGEFLKRMSKSLSEADLELFNLAYVRELPSNEICEKLGINEVSYYQRKHRLRSRLLPLLDELMHNSPGER